MGKTDTHPSFLQFIPFSEFSLWDVKRYLASEIQSNYDVVLLSQVIRERSEKVKLFQYPEKEFGILGVSNSVGLFDAYTKKGKEINQSYKKMCDGDLAYNPYRINVGSIGLKTNLHKHNFVSPAYVVFHCDKKILAQFLYTIFQTNVFNKIINENTTGSVRQNLKFETLANIKIPLPKIKQQQEILNTYFYQTKISDQKDEKAVLIEKNIEKYIFHALGIEVFADIEAKKGLQFISFRDVERWAVDFLSQITISSKRLTGKYKAVKLRSFIKSYQYGLSEKSSKKTQGTPMLRMNNIFNSEVVVDDLKYIQIDDTTKEKYRLNKGDLLFNRTNSKELVGKTGVFEIDGEYTFASYLIRVVLDTAQANVHYINYLFNSPLLQYQKDMTSRQITGQANINAQEMQEFLFPLPPLEVQNEIAATISKMKEEAKILRKEAEENRKKALEEFEQAIFL